MPRTVFLRPVPKFSTFFDNQDRDFELDPFDGTLFKKIEFIGWRCALGPATTSFEIVIQESLDGQKWVDLANADPGANSQLAMTVVPNLSQMRIVLKETGGGPFTCWVEGPAVYRKGASV